MTTTNFPKDGKALLTLERSSSSPIIYTVTFTGGETPDNRLTHKFLDAILAALEHVEQEWDRTLSDEEKKGGAALVTTGQIVEGAKFYSNGLDFENAISDPNFFDTHLNKVYEKLLSFPIPTVASIGGHAFAAGFGLAMAHDYRVFNGAKGYLSMNEIDFGAQIPPGLYAALSSKMTSNVLMRKVVLEGHRFGAKEALAERIIDIIAPAQGEQGGAKKTLEVATELAKRVAPKARADCYGSNKLVMYFPYLEILRMKNEVATGRL
ncbi:ClpP/crotonase [Acaromyces ingoldii]|uniref:ClpP/crotonase n=1 Tax=Acaromyces ingoldii TaxID=215250 RepID=A0A316YUB0_9BASI|nr:ClpP/crotonase [Acaromyces ingoldii]PWN92692.1 ClpP/crotonase [Acaromyces ingoldii]